MDGIFIAGTIFSLFVLFFGIGSTIYFINRYQNNRVTSRGSDIALWIFLAIGLIICSGAFIFTSGIKRWLIIGSGVLCITVPMIICNIIDRRHNLESCNDFNFGIHLLFVLSVLCIPAGRIGMLTTEQKFVDYACQNGEPKTIDHIRILTLTEDGYQWVEGSTGEIAIPTGKKDAEWIVLVMTDGSEVLLCRRDKKVDYEKLYPKGNKVFVYKGDVFSPQ